MLYEGMEERSFKCRIKFFSFAIMLLFLPYLSFSQAETKDSDLIRIKARLYDKEKYNPISEAHIINLNTKRGTWSDSNGYFELEVGERHLVKISNVSYRVEFLQAAYFLSNKEKSDTVLVFLTQKLYNIKEVDVYPFTKEEFAYKFVHDHFAPDSIDFIKKKIKASEDDLYVLQPYLAFSLNFKSKKEKQLIRLKEIKAQHKKQEEFYLLAKNISGLDGEALSLFIQYCAFSSYYIRVNNLFVLARKLREKYKEYRFNKDKPLPK